jgi:hypothetical protein
MFGCPMDSSVDFFLRVRHTVFMLNPGFRPVGVYFMGSQQKIMATMLWGEGIRSASESVSVIAWVGLVKLTIIKEPFD